LIAAHTGYPHQSAGHEPELLRFMRTTGLWQAVWLLAGLVALSVVTAYVTGSNAFRHQQEAALEEINGS